jgi:hypothetical protein
MENIESTDQKKYTFLKVICYLSMFSNGFHAFKSASSAISLKDPSELTELSSNFNEIINSIKTYYPEEVIVAMRSFYEVYLLNIVNISAVDFVAHTLGFIGVFFMNKFMKKGFYIYLVSQLLLIFNLYLFLPMNALGSVWITWQIFICSVFSIIYATQLKKLVNA